MFPLAAPHTSTSRHWPGSTYQGELPLAPSEPLSALHFIALSEELHQSLLPPLCSLYVVLLEPLVLGNAAKKRAEPEKERPEERCRSRMNIYAIRERAADGQGNFLCSLNRALPTAVLSYYKKESQVNLHMNKAGNFYDCKRKQGRTL